MNIIQQNFEESLEVLQAFIDNSDNLQRVQQAGDMMVAAINNGNKIISCGNGGSMCDAMHFAEELTGRFRNDRRAIPAIAISDPAHITCVANDYGFDAIFSRYIEALGQSGDVILAISTSGNSQNIINAVNTAKDKKMNVIALTGKTGGLLASLANIEIRSPQSKFSDRTQEIHIKVIHCLIDYIEQQMIK